jgi:serine/threonine-protein kinase
MMKHLQEPPPSVLEERKDLPAAVGRVITRAMAKRPEDRFQTVKELTDELTGAAVTADPELASNTSPDSSDRKTNRIVVPTGSNEAPRNTSNEDHDEATVVRPRPEAAAAVAVAAEPEIFSDVIEEPRESFNPWRVVVPAIAGLLVVFAVVYALTRNSSSTPAANDNSQPLTVEPGSQPVQPSGTPTGAGEQGITPNASPTVEGGNTNTPATNPGATPDAGLPPRTGNENRNDAQPNENTSNPEATPTPARTPTQLPTPRATPTPDANPGDEPPPPPPTPKKEQTPKATPAPGNEGAQAPGAASAPELP